MIWLAFYKARSDGSVKSKTWGLVGLTWRGRQGIMTVSSKSGMRWRRWMPKPPGRGEPLTSPPHSQHQPLKPAQISHLSLNRPRAQCPLPLVSLYLCTWLSDSFTFNDAPRPSSRGISSKKLPPDRSTLFLLCFHSPVCTSLSWSSPPVLWWFVPCLSLLLDGKLPERRSSPLTSEWKCTKDVEWMSKTKPLKRYKGP